MSSTRCSSCGRKYRLGRQTCPSCGTTSSIGTGRDIAAGLGNMGSAYVHAATTFKGAELPAFFIPALFPPVSILYASWALPWLNRAVYAVVFALFGMFLGVACFIVHAFMKAILGGREWFALLGLGIALVASGVKWWPIWAALMEKLSNG